MPLAESSLERVGHALPPGHFIGARGDHWHLHPNPADPAKLRGFVENYRRRFNAWPIYPTHHMYQAISAMRTAYAKALETTGGAWPSDAQLARAFHGLEFDSLTSRIKIRPDGQGLEPQLIGTTVRSGDLPFPVMNDMVIYPPELITAPVGQKSVDWLKTLTPDFLNRAPG